MKVSLIARQLGLSRRRIDKWIRLDELQEKPGVAALGNARILPKLFTLALGGGR
jgi:hypothetical protein